MNKKIVIGVDPAVTHSAHSDETGIIVVAKTLDGIAYVLDDLSCKGPPAYWADRIIQGYHQYQANYVVAEINQGGDLVELLLKSLDPLVRFKAVRATKNKHSRALPVSMLYEQGKVFHARPFPELEEQMCTFTLESSKSPDRLDALVWGLTELMKPKDTIPALKCWNLN